MSAVDPPQRRRLPTLGRRGGGWVVVQIFLIGGILLSALAGRGWSSTLAPFAYAIGGVAIVVGSALLLAGGFGLGHALTPFPAPRGDADLQTNGVYGLVRHPMYGGGILVGFGWSAIFATVIGLALTVILALFAELKSRREEIWLEQSHPDYAQYRGQTPHRLIPYVW